MNYNELTEIFVGLTYCLEATGFTNSYYKVP